MLTDMRNLEIHLVNSNGDVEMVVKAGLMESTDAVDPECSNCTNEDIGHVAGTFYPYVVALDDHNHWLVCEHCASNVLDTSPVPDEKYFQTNFTQDAND